MWHDYPCVWSGLTALWMGSSPSHPSLSHPPTSLRDIKFEASEPLLVLRASGVQYGVNSWWKLTPPFQVPSTAIVVSFSAHPLSAVLQYKFILLFTFIDLLHKVHSHHTFTFSSCFSMVIPILGLITNLGETGCYNSLPLIGTPSSVFFLQTHVMPFLFSHFRSLDLHHLPSIIPGQQAH
jgi:hypothetical protein